MSFYRLHPQDKVFIVVLVVALVFALVALLVVMEDFPGIEDISANYIRPALEPLGLWHTDKNDNFNY